MPFHDFDVFPFFLRFLKGSYGNSCVIFGYGPSKTAQGAPKNSEWESLLGLFGLAD